MNNKLKEFFSEKSVIRVAVFDKQEATRFEWRKKKKCFLLKDEPEGFYLVDGYSYNVFSKEEIENGAAYDIKFIIIGKKVYYKPYVEVTFIDGEKRVVEANNLEEAERYAENLRNFYMPLSFSLTDKNLENFETS